MPKAEIAKLLGQRGRQLNHGLTEGAQTELKDFLDFLGSESADPEEIRLTIHQRREADRRGKEALEQIATQPADTDVTTAPEKPRRRSLSDEEIAAAAARIATINVTGSTLPGAPKPAPRPVKPESANTSALVEQLVEAAKGSAIIHTDVAGGVMLHYKEGDRLSTTGFKTFGDGAYGSTSELPHHFSLPVGSRNIIRDKDGQLITDMVEAVAFPDATQDVYETVMVREEQGFMRRPKEVPRQQKTGEKPIMITNPVTGQEEKGVYFDYAYYPSLAGPMAERDMGLARYTESVGARTGNMLVVRTLQPESLISQLRQSAESGDRTLIRAAVEKIVMERGGISQSAWEQGIPQSMGGRSNPIRPPYEGLAEGDLENPKYKMYVVKPGSGDHPATAHANGG
jgi:hypothetical protein